MPIAAQLLHIRLKLDSVTFISDGGRRREEESPPRIFFRNDPLPDFQATPSSRARGEAESNGNNNEITKNINHGLISRRILSFYRNDTHMMHVYVLNVIVDNTLVSPIIFCYR